VPLSKEQGQQKEKEAPLSGGSKRLLKKLQVLQEKKGFLGLKEDEGWLDWKEVKQGKTLEGPLSQHRCWTRSADEGRTEGSDKQGLRNERLHGSRRGQAE